jgi:hypothetical protein
MWDKVETLGRAESDLETIAKASAYAEYLPRHPELVAEFGAPDHDELECWINVRDLAVPELIGWLDRTAQHPAAMPLITLRGLYFAPDDPQYSRMPGPRWSEFLQTKAIGTFDSYLIAFEVAK